MKWYFEENGSAEAEALLEDHAAGRRDPMAPDLVIAEFTNGIWKKIRRAERALDLALALDHPVYDCLYLAAAIAHEASLVTADRTLARAARKVLAQVEIVG